MTGGNGPASSCRPDRLYSFAQVTVGMAEAMGQRINALQGAIPSYMSGCDPAYRVDVTGVPTGLGGWGISLHDLGDWTNGIAVQFLRADGVNGYIGGGTGPDSLFTLTDGQITAGMPARFRADPYLGMRATETTPFDWAAHPNAAEDVLKGLADNGAFNTITLGLYGANAINTSRQFLDELDKIGVDVQGSGGLAAIDTADYALAGLSAVAGFAHQWSAAKGLPESTKFLESAAFGVADGGAAGAGIAATVATAPVLGPFAPVAGLVTAVTFDLGFKQDPKRGPARPQPE